MPTLLFVSGSQRRDSFNGRLLENLAARVRGRCTVRTLPPAHVDLPLFDQDLETEPGVVARAAVISRRLAACDGLVVAAPEYNGQPTPYLKNIVDWVTRLPRVDPRVPNPFLGRPVLLCSASTGRSGGAVAIPHYRALFGYVGATVAGETLCLPLAESVWYGTRYLWDDAFEDRVQAGLARILLLAGACGQAHAGAAGVDVEAAR